jgi:cytochrome c oxidase cbb3-type subunit I/II
MYVAIWFYIATDRHGRRAAHLQQPRGAGGHRSRATQIYAGVQDAFMQWWYGHNAVAFFLTTPFLGLMYYFMPKAADRPVFSYRLSILHFWSLVFIYIWAGPHHLHYTALPEWASARWACSSRDAVDAELGRHDQRPADAARGVEQGRRATRC